MAESGNGCSSSGKRKWPGEGCGQEFPGDPPTDAPLTPRGEFVCVITEVPTLTLKGVTIRIAVEIKKFNGMAHEGFYITIGQPEDLEQRRFVAAIVHDLVRLFWDPEYPVTSLNINSVEFWIRKRKDLPTVGCGIGKPLLDKFILANRATLPHVPPDGWVGLDKKKLGELKDWMKARGLVFWKELEADIMKVRLSQGGRLREDAQQIPAAIEDLETDLDQLNLNEQITSWKAKYAALEAKYGAFEAKYGALEAENKSLKESSKQTKEKDNATITSLKAKHAALEVENKSLKEKKEENDATITHLMLTLSDPPAPDLNLPDFHTDTFLNKSKDLEVASEAEDVQVKGLKAALEAKDVQLKGLKAALEAKDVQLKGLKAALEVELKKARDGYLIYTYLPRSPTTGLMPRHNQESLQDDD